MRREAVSAAAELSGRSFDGFPDATRSVLEALESQLPGSALFVARIDHEENELKIIDARGDESFNLSAGAVFPLDGSFCVRMVADRGPRLTGDAAAEPAYRDAAVRTELGISSYAGVPLELSDGNRVGSLCAYDHGVDRFEDDDLQLLAIMARLLANEIEREERESRLLEMNERLAELATTDSLTGLRNRGAFETALERDWQLARRGTVESFVVVADVDGLKPVNDRFGHAAGDRLLRQVADALRRTARETDIVGRLGGDEFGAVLVGSDPAGAQGFGERLDQKLSEGIDPWVVPEVSTGVARLADFASSAEALDAADGAMYEQKRSRTGRESR